MLGRPVVLAYHGVDEIAKDADPHKLIVTPARLSSHIRFLKQSGYRFVTAEALIVAGEVPKPSRRTAVLTFDDGWADWLEHALPLLIEEGIAATFYVCPGWWDRPEHPDHTGPAGRLLDRDGTSALVEAGMEVGSHSMTHPDLRKLDDEALEDELVRSKALIKEVTGRACRTLAYPYGLYDERVQRAASQAGYDLAFDWLPGAWKRYALPRLPGPSHSGPLRLALKLMGLRKPGR